MTLFYNFHVSTILLCVSWLQILISKSSRFANPQSSNWPKGQGSYTLDSEDSECGGGDVMASKDAGFYLDLFLVSRCFNQARRSLAVNPILRRLFLMMNSGIGSICVWKTTGRNIPSFDHFSCPELPDSTILQPCSARKTLKSAMLILPIL